MVLLAALVGFGSRAGALVDRVPLTPPPVAPAPLLSVVPTAVEPLVIEDDESETVIVMNVDGSAALTESSK